ncbi:MAG: hypothetical protein AABZ39_17560 [Spirochaetota bacterium]
MQLSTKPDLDEAVKRWEHYWAGDVYKRPPVVLNVRKPGKTAVPPKGHLYHFACTKDYRGYLDHIDTVIDSTDYLAESIPMFSPDHGPDQFAALCGARLQFSEGSMNTNWVEPMVDDWRTFLPNLRVNTDNETWKSLMEFSRQLREHGKGRYIVSMCDLHSNADTLSALRNPERLCMDFYDSPERITEAMRSVRKMYPPVYNALYDAGGMKENGTSCWIPFWHSGRYATIQCDFICMVSPDTANEYIIPALEEEANFLDHSIYHLDGPQALTHLDSLLAIKKLDAIQWVPGDGQAPQHEWMDVLKKVQKAGKGLQLWGSVDVIKKYHKELDPKGVVYCPHGVRDRAEADALLTWLEQNT